MTKYQWILFWFNNEYLNLIYIYKISYGNSEAARTVGWISQSSGELLIREGVWPTWQRREHHHHCQNSFHETHMAISLQASVRSSFYIHIKAFPNQSIFPSSSSSSSTSLSLLNPMLRKFLSSSARYSLPLTAAAYSNITSFSVRIPKGFSYRYRYRHSHGIVSSITLHNRLIHSLRVIAMAEQSSSTTSQQSHKRTNRLAAEQSPYLLQHAHNPVLYKILYSFPCSL